MKNPTKVQATIDFDEVPQWVLDYVQHRAFSRLEAAVEELSHAIRQARRQEDPDAESLAYHIGRARTAMFDADALLGDAHQTIDSYLQYVNADSSPPVAEPEPQPEEIVADEENKADESKSE